VWKSFTPQQQEAANSAVKDTFITWITRWQKQNADAMEEMVRSTAAGSAHAPDILLASLKAWDEVAKENSDKSPTSRRSTSRSASTRPRWCPRSATCSRRILSPRTTTGPRQTSPRQERKRRAGDPQDIADRHRAAVRVTSAYAQSLDYEFFKSRVEPIFLQKRPGHTRCVVCHAERSNNAFRLEKLPAAGRWTEEQSRRNYEMASRLVVPGKPDSSLLLLQPLAPEAGGNPITPGVGSSRRRTTRSGRPSPSGSRQAARAGRAY